MRAQNRATAAMMTGAMATGGLGGTGQMAQAAAEGQASSQMAMLSAPQSNPADESSETAMGAEALREKVASSSRMKLRSVLRRRKAMAIIRRNIIAGCLTGAALCIPFAAVADISGASQATAP